jgi:hypothetical protein
MDEFPQEDGMECEDDIHDWEYSSWGVIIGVSKCRKCGKVAKEKDFNIEPIYKRGEKGGNIGT